MHTTLKNLQKIEDAIIATAFIIMVLSAFAQVINRNFVGAGISWFEELARYCMIYMALLATEVGLRDGSQIAVTAVTDSCPPFLRKLLRIVAKLIVVVFSAIIFYTSWELMGKQFKTGQLSAGLGVHMAVPYFILPLAFGLITLVQGWTLIALVKGLLSGADEEKAEGEKA